MDDHFVPDDCQIEAADRAVCMSSNIYLFEKGGKQTRLNGTYLAPVSATPVPKSASTSAYKSMSPLSAMPNSWNVCVDCYVGFDCSLSGGVYEFRKAKNEDPEARTLTRKRLKRCLKPQRHVGLPSPDDWRWINLGLSRIKFLYLDSAKWGSSK